MNINDYYISENEKPLDRIVENGGFCAIFRTICCIGDSLSSGEIQTVKEDGSCGYYDLYEYSWGQYIARMTGAKVYNFSKGGMSAKEYLDSFADSKGFWGCDKIAQAYIMALGVNDLFGFNREVGSVNDIDLDDYSKNKETFAGQYGKIAQKVREISPDSKLFFMTMPKETSDDDMRRRKKADHARLLNNLTRVFDNSYVIDLFEYAPVYDEKFKYNFYFNSHMNPAGYLLTAKMIASYIDYIIRKNPKTFETAALIGTGIDTGVTQGNIK